MDVFIKILRFVEKNHKALLLISFLIFFVGLGTLVKFKMDTGSVMLKDISLKGGKSITVSVNTPVNVLELENYLSNSLGTDITVKSIKDVFSGKQIAISIETEEDIDTNTIINALKDYGLEFSEDKISVSYFSTTFGEAFYKQLVLAVTAAVIIISLVIYWRIRYPVPSLAVIFTTIFDIVMTLAFLDIIGHKISAAGIAALLMIIGYAIDDNLIISFQYLRNKDKEFAERIHRGVITAMTLTFTTVAALIAIYFTINAAVIKEIVFILAVSELFDEIGTWFFNIPFYKYWEVRKG